MNSNSKAIFRSKVIEKLQLIVGGLYTTVFVITIIASLTDKHADMLSTYIFMVIMLVLSVKLYLLGRKRKALREDFFIYERILAKEQSGSIDKLATCLGVPASKVKQNLELMIKYRYYNYAIIDHQSNRIILAEQNNQFTIKIELEEADYQQPINENMKNVPITCKNCGGVNQVVKGQVQECEFCGSPISS